MVGVGVRMGNGCTSGHGVCGLPRFALRSFIAVPTFMATGFGLATLKYHEPFLNKGEIFGDKYAEGYKWVTFGILVLGYAYGMFILIKEKEAYTR